MNLKIVQFKYNNKLGVEFRDHKGKGFKGRLGFGIFGFRFFHTLLKLIFIFPAQMYLTPPRGGCRRLTSGLGIWTVTIWYYLRKNEQNAKNQRTKGEYIGVKSSRSAYISHCFGKLNKNQLERVVFYALKRVVLARQHYKPIQVIYILKWFIKDVVENLKCH